MPTYIVRLEETDGGAPSRDAVVVASNSHSAKLLLAQNLEAGGNRYTVQWETWRTAYSGSVLVGVGGELQDLSALSALQNRIAAIEAGE